MRKASHEQDCEDKREPSARQIAIVPHYLKSESPFCLKNGTDHTPIPLFADSVVCLLAFTELLSTLPHLSFYPLHISLPDNLSPHAGTSGSSVRNLNPTSGFSLDVLHFLYHLRRYPETQAQFFCQIQPLCITVFLSSGATVALNEGTALQETAVARRWTRAT